LLVFVVAVACTHRIPLPDTALHYAENTPEETRAVHRAAVAHLRAGEFQQACDALDGVTREDRRRLTEYLTLLCATRLPDRALSADSIAELAITGDEPPALLDTQRDALDRHRAWIAALQDDLGDLAAARFQLPARPLPSTIPSTALSTIAAWRTRGTRFHAATYTQTLQRAKANDFATRLALEDFLSSLTASTAERVLFVDLTGVTAPPPPPMSLPADSEL
jgi:hypothetical protein